MKKGLKLYCEGVLSEAEGRPKQSQNNTNTYYKYPLLISPCQACSDTTSEGRRSGVNEESMRKLPKPSIVPPLLKGGVRRTGGYDRTQFPHDERTAITGVLPAICYLLFTICF